MEMNQKEEGSKTLSSKARNRSNRTALEDVDRAFAGWAREMRKLVVSKILPLYDHEVCDVNAVQDDINAVLVCFNHKPENPNLRRFTQTAGPESRELMGALGAVRILVHLCASNQPEVKNVQYVRILARQTRGNLQMLPVNVYNTCANTRAGGCRRCIVLIAFVGHRRCVYRGFCVSRGATGEKRFCFRDLLPHIPWMPEGLHLGAHGAFMSL